MFNFEQLKESLSKQGYEYKQFLGGSGFSNVLLCQSNEHNKDMVIKRSIKHKFTEKELNSFLSLCHPNIVKLYDIFDDDFAQYLVTEYCSKGTIQQKGRLSYEKFVVYAKQILEAIAYCHSNKIAHQDISPNKIFIDQNHNIKIANILFSKNEANSNSLMFHPPEMILNDEVCPYKADIWALGITFFFMATGNYPFQSNNIDELKKMILKNELNFFKYKINPQIRLLINKMTAKNKLIRLSAEDLLKLPIFSIDFNKSMEIYKNKKRCKLASLRIENPKSVNSYQSKSYQIGNKSVKKVTFNPKVETN